MLYSLSIIIARGGKPQGFRVDIHGDNSFYSMPEGQQQRFASISKGMFSTGSKAISFSRTALWVLYSDGIVPADFCGQQHSFADFKETIKNKRKCTSATAP